MNTYEIAIIGQKDIILGFKAIGITAESALTNEEALNALKKLKEETEGEKPKYAIIMITEELVEDFPEEEFKKLSLDILPSILVIPGIKGSTGLGMKRLGKIVEKAIGSNILK